MDVTSPSDIPALLQRIRELEQALHESQRRATILQHVIDGIHSSIYATDTEGYLRVVNQPFLQLIHMSAEQVVDKPIAELFPPELIALWQPAVDAVLRTRQRHSVEEESRYGAVTRTFLSERFPLFDNEGQLYAIAGVATDISDRKQAEAALRESQQVLRAIIDNAPAVIYVRAPDRRLMIVNQLYAKVVGRSVEEIVGKTEYDLFPKELVDSWADNEREMFATGQPMQYPNTMYVSGEPHDFLTTQFPLYDDHRQPYAICGISADVTELRRAEKERASLQEEIIIAQQAALRELSTPLIPLAEGVVVMPLVGSMDSNRAQQVMETLLTGVSRHSASTVILDITGLPVVDTQVANVLLQATRAARLLGAEVVLTGIGPEVAQTLISIGTDLRDITTPGTLQSGINYALQRSANGH